MVRLPVKLNEDEYRALFRSATDQRRHPRDQAAVLIAAQLKQLGLLKPATSEAVDAP